MGNEQDPPLRNEPILRILLNNKKHLLRKLVEDIEIRSKDIAIQSNDTLTIEFRIVLLSTCMIFQTLKILYLHDQRNTLGIHSRRLGSR